MKTRTYNIESRRRQQALLKEGIAAATAELHAANGVFATSYIDIAKRAGVSLPTVYKHFPTQRELLQGCTAHIIAKAPLMPVEKIMAASDLPAAARLLVSAMEKQHLHFEPWSAWREDRQIPFLTEMVACIRQARAVLVAELLAHHGVRGGQSAAAWESILSFDFWHRLVREHQLPRQAAHHILIECLLAVIGPTPAPPSTPRPRRKS